MFACFDQLTSADQKRRIADIIFARRGSDVEPFEQVLIEALLSGFLTNRGQLRFRRVFALSLMSSALILVGASAAFVREGGWTSSPDEVDEIAAGIAFLVGLLLVGFTLSLPFDFLSVRITKEIFLGGFSRRRGVGLAMTCDASLSFLAPVMAALLTVYAADRAFPPNVSIHPKQAVMLGLTITCLSSLTLTVLQIVASVAGNLLRAMLLVCRLNHWVAENSNAHAHPFMYLGLIAGAFAGMATAIS